MTNKQKIKLGHTNGEKYIIDNEFHLTLRVNEFNHKINYKTVNQFDFAPNLISQTKEKLVFEAIQDAKTLSSPTTNQLKSIGKQLRVVHLAEPKDWPKFNLRRRVKAYLKTIHEKGIHVPIIEDNYKEMMRLITRMNQLNPVHNDMWWENILVDKNDKVWFTDWEYSTRGDKHFDLAFFIESNKINPEDEEVFLKAYGENDEYDGYVKEWLPGYKRFVHWITLCWAYAQPEGLPFPVEWMEKRMKELKK